MHASEKLVPTAAETFFIRRRRDGNTIEREAYINRVSPAQYRRWERGEMKSLPVLDVGELTELEEYVLRRRREGWSLTEMSKHMKRRAIVIGLMERGVYGIEPLREFWKKRKS